MPRYPVRKKRHKAYSLRKPKIKQQFKQIGKGKMRSKRRYFEDNTYYKTIRKGKSRTRLGGVKKSLYKYRQIGPLPRLKKGRSKPPPGYYKNRGTA